MAHSGQALKERVRAFWDEEACGERYGHEQDRIRYEIEPEILPFADFRTAEGKSVLEIGVGMGSDFIRWVRAGARATGVDLTQRAIDITRRRLMADGHEARLHVADAESLPFEDGEFDIVYSWGVLHHTPNPGRAVQETLRVLKPGGRLKIMVYHRRSWVALAAWVRFGPLSARPFIGLRKAVSHMESPGTQAFTTSEARRMLCDLVDVSIAPKLTHWDRRWAPGVAGLCGDRFGWFLLLDATKPL